MSVASTCMHLAPENTPARPRPALVRRDTDLILSYYQSEDAGKTYVAQQNDDDYVLKLAPSTSTATAGSSTSTASACASDERSSSPSSTYSESDDDVPKKNALPSPSPAVAVAAPAPSLAQRRTSKGSSGGSDKRRVAIVEMDAEGHEDGRRRGAGSDYHHHHRRLNLNHHEQQQHQQSVNGTPSSSSSSSSSSSDLLSRRGRGNLAFVAPPDASPSLYAELTPPCLSAPVVVSPQLSEEDQIQSGKKRRERGHGNASEGTAGAGAAASSTSSKGGHQRSQSDAIEPRRLRMRKTSRDVGIVGTSITLSPTQVKKMDLGGENHHRQEEDADPLHPQISPVFQTPSSITEGDGPRQVDPLLEKAEALMKEARVGRERGRDKDREREREREYEQQQQKPVNGHSSSSNNNNNKRDSAISPVIVGISPDQMWQTLPPSASPPSMISYIPNPAGSFPVQLASPAGSPASFVVPPPTYLYYQPGVHATAGPLPPPPRRMDENDLSPSTSPPLPPRRLSPSTSFSPPPPRPPRLHTPSTSERSTQRLSPASSTTEVENERSASPERPSRSPGVQSSPAEDHSATGHAERQGSSSKSSHIREGAFVSLPPTPAVSTDIAPLDISKRSGSSREDIGLARENLSSSSNTSRIRKASSEQPLRHDTPLAIDHQQENVPDRNLPKHRSGFDLRNQISRSTLKSSSSASPIKTSKPLPELAPSTPADVFSPPSDSGHGLVIPASFEAKRFSRLPKTPSVFSGSHSNKSDHSGDRMSPRFRGASAKIKSAYPEAMYFGEIAQLRKASERLMVYAKKINELANHDAGLEDWVKATKRQYTKSRISMDDGPPQSPTGPRGPSSSPFVVQRRHTSRGSIGSEVTFPRRLDAYVATDLMPSEDDVIPEGPPPSLPYPTLAQGARVPPSRTFGGSAASSIAPSSLHRVPSTQSSSKSTTTGNGFFSSLGRKSSEKREKNASVASKLLMRRTPTLPPPAPRPVQIIASPSLPGGPRAPPNRVQRTQSVIAPSASRGAAGPYAAPAAARVERHMSHRSSSTRSASVSMSPIRAALREGSPEFEKQAKKLCDLMPNADPRILRRYLLRAGQDMIAIGQYLEDERKGCLRRD